MSIIKIILNFTHSFVMGMTSSATWLGGPHQGDKVTNETVGLVNRPDCLVNVDGLTGIIRKQTNPLHLIEYTTEFNIHSAGRHEMLTEGCN